MNHKVRHDSCICAVGLALLTGALAASASVIATNPPAESITRDRIAELPLAQRSAWLEYLEQSQRQRQAEKDAFRAEMKSAGIKTPIEPPHGNSSRSIPLDRDSSWYASAKARHIADVIVSFQTPSGGWSKNLDMSKDPRRPGEAFMADNRSRFLSAADFDISADPDWDYMATIDNDATTTQIAFLAKAVAAIGAEHAEMDRAACLRGINYLLTAQFPNGGWPQVWPLQGGYHDAITYNDEAMIHVLEQLRKAADGEQEFAFVPKEIRKRAAASFARGIRCILATQIVANGKLTVWPQQSDALMMKPVSGRNFEPPAQCASESASMLLFLMNELPHPDAQQQHSIRAAAAWFKKTAIHNQSWERTEEGRKQVPRPGAGPLWARYYQTGTDLPVFGDRDKTIHDNVNELSAERRNGYMWFSSDAQRALERFEKWDQEYREIK